VIVTASPVSDGVLTDLPGLVVKAAARAGLGYTQHIIAITALIRDSRLMPWEPDGEHGPLGAVEAIHAGRNAVGVEYEPRWSALAADGLTHARWQGARG
jgi:hypothetical protein